jgi:hypothetical protein
MINENILLSEISFIVDNNIQTKIEKLIRTSLPYDWTAIKKIYNTVKSNDFKIDYNNWQIKSNDGFLTEIFSKNSFFNINIRRDKRGTSKFYIWNVEIKDNTTNNEFIVYIQKSIEENDPKVLKRIVNFLSKKFNININSKDVSFNNDNV